MRIQLLVGALLVAGVVSQPSCTYTNGGNTYNFSPLSNSQDYTVTDSNQQTYTINLCRSTVTQLCGADVAICQSWAGNGKASAGKYSTFTWQPGQSGATVTAQFAAGDDGRTSEIDFFCDQTIEVGTPAYDSENPQLHYKFKWNTKAACPSSNPSTTTTGQSSGGPSSGGSTGHSAPPPSGGLTGGGVFLIILSCCIIVYLGGGIAFNRFQKHETGVDMLPNLQFWLSLPGLIKDGAMFIVNKTCRRGGYSTI